MELALPIAVLSLAATFTYIFCLRPMRRGGHCLTLHRGTACFDERQGTAADSAAELAALRQEIEALKTELQVPSHDDQGNATVRPTSPS